MSNEVSIVKSVYLNSQKSPDKLALADSQTSVSYKELWLCITAASDYLLNSGLVPRDRVVVHCNQSVSYIVWDLAVQLSHGIFVPLEKNCAASRISAIIEDTDAAFYIGSKKPVNLPDNIVFIDISSCTEADTFNSVALTDDEPIFPFSDETAQILFSTGTTGKSKGIVLTHGNNMALAENVIYGVEMKKNNVELIPMPLSHSHGLRRTYGNLVNGSTAVFSDGVTLLKGVFNMMDEYHVTSMDLSPSMLSIIFKLSKDSLKNYSDTMDYIQLGSAPLSEDDKNHLCRLLPGTRLYNFYGSTEAGCSCLLEFGSMPNKPGCIGKPARNACFIVVDENKNEISSSPDNPGFLASRGAINMKGYFKEPELTASVMQDGYIYTKDMGYIDDDGYIYMLGRKDDVINYGGIKISPEEIESIVMKYEHIEDCACIPTDDPLTGQAPKLFIVPSSDFDMNSFKAFLKGNLDANKQPKYIEKIHSIPRTFNGKIKRNALIEL